MLQNKKVLVTGASGFIGQHVVAELLRHGAVVRGIGLTKRPEMPIYGRFEYFRMDMTNNDLCQEACEGMDYMFMCSASTAGAAVIVNNPTAHITPNIVMNARLLDAAHKAGIKKTVFVSSSTGYPEADHPVKESEFFKGSPTDVYYSVGWMKRYTEILCQTYAMKIKNPMSISVVRPSNVYGPYDKFDLAHCHVTPALIGKVITRSAPIKVWGDGEDRRDLIYIDDFIEGLFKVFFSKDFYTAVNIASGRAYSVKEILSAIIKADGYENPQVVFDATKPQTIRSREINVSYAAERYKFKTSTSLESGISKTIEWFRKCKGSF